MGSSPFHPGEWEAQRRAGGGPPGAGIRPFMTDQHRAFFEALPYALFATVIDGWPAATLLAGRPGFISSPDAHTLMIESGADGSDPVRQAISPGAAAAILGIDLATRRRNRANGIVSAATPASFTVHVEQGFGNCPQYIHPREVQLSPGGRVEELPELDAPARALISAADTFFVATAARTGDPRGGADVSHRGGPPGFLRVEGATITIPDYSGNRYFNTLGNLVSNPRAALLFVDVATSALLHVQGNAEIVWDGPEVRALPGAERLWRVHVERAFRRDGAQPRNSR